MRTLALASTQALWSHICVCIGALTHFLYSLITAHSLKLLATVLLLLMLDHQLQLLALWVHLPLPVEVVFEQV